jgi:energy-coupling factor transporter ATP-binding protein EcfA2
MNVYTISNFCFSYPGSSNKIQFTGNISFNHNDCILIQGASGSGKSTLLAALKGLLPNLINGTINGKILFHNQDITTINPNQLATIGYLQQNPDSQLICHKVWNELAFGLENLKIPPKQIALKIKKICAEFNLTHLLNRQTNTLSGGEKQTVNLLSILLLDPEVLLLDEPTAFLDPESAIFIMHIIQNYIQNKTVIIIEHNLHLVKHLVNRAIFIDHNGIIVEQEIPSIQKSISIQPCKMLIAQNNQALLEINNLSFAYPGERKLFNYLNLKLVPGQIIGICGKNGSGKSTLLKMIAKLIPSPEKILWRGNNLKYISTKTLWQELALLWQNPESHFLFESVKAELAQDPTLLTQFNLSNQANSNPFTLSEGQKRRLSLAITMQKPVQLLLLDEPTFGQDYLNKQLLAQQINKLVCQGVSIIIVSHDLNFIAALSNQNYLLKEGKLVNVSL